MTDTTWIVVADRSRARLFSDTGNGADLVEMRDLLNPDGRAAPRDLEADRPPRASSHAGSPNRPAIEPETTAQEKVEQRFAREIAELLEHGRTAHQYARLVLVAAPRFLGRLQAALTKSVGDLVATTLSKDYTALSAEELRMRLPRRRAGVRAATPANTGART